MGQNRSMMAKRIKYIKQSRARPRTLRMNNGHQKVPQSVDRSKIPQEFMGLFAYRERAKSFIDDYLEALYPTHGHESIARQEALEQSRAGRPVVTLQTMLVDGRFRKVVMFSDLGDTCFNFIEYLVNAALIRRSITYNNRDRAMSAYLDGGLRWKETIRLNDVE